MVASELVNEDALNTGRALLAAADQDRVPVRAAFWLYDSDRQRWTLVLEADPEADLSEREFAVSLFAAARKIPDEQTRSAALSLLMGPLTMSTTPHPLAEVLRPMLGSAKSVFRTRLADTRVGDAWIEGAVLYRLDPKQVL
jgi:hypothetical protein